MSPIAAPLPPPLVGDSVLVNTQFLIVDEFGETLDDIPVKQIEDIRYMLDTYDQLTLLVPTADTTLAPYAMKGASYECQLWMQGNLYFWGVLGRVQNQSGGLTEITCYGLFWYFHKLFFGAANRRNLLSGDTNNDPKFVFPGYSGTEPHNSSGFIGDEWTPVECAATLPTTPPNPILGWQGNTNVAQLVAAGGGLDAYYFTRVVFPPADDEKFLFLTAWYYVVDPSTFAPAATYAATGNQQRGLFIELEDEDGNLIVPDPSWLSPLYTFAQITNATPQGDWIRLQTAILVPPMSIYSDPIHASCRLYAPAGTTLWGAVSLVHDDNLGTPPSGEDQATTIATIVDYAQGRIPILVSPNDPKTDLNIDTDCPATGVVRIQQYPFANHQSIEDALVNYTTLYDGVDFSIEFPDRYHRTFTTYPKSMKGRKGFLQPDLALVYGGNLGLVVVDDSQISVDSENAASSVVEFGVNSGTTSDSGAANEEGGAFDLSLMNGKDIELVETAPPDIVINSLASLAIRRLKMLNGVPVAAVIRVADGLAFVAPALRGMPGLHVGDVVPVYIQYGWITIDQLMRIVQIDLYPNQGFVADFTMNLPDPYAGIPPLIS